MYYLIKNQLEKTEKDAILDSGFQYVAVLKSDEGTGFLRHGNRY